ncbi:hypothetical protein PFISCL1PPCAC_17155, partial [Pristionchus fissidentatus]
RQAKFTVFTSGSLVDLIFTTRKTSTLYDYLRELYCEDQDGIFCILRSVSCDEKRLLFIPRNSFAKNDDNELTRLCEEDDD